MLTSDYLCAEGIEAVVEDLEENLLDVVQADGDHIPVKRIRGAIEDCVQRALETLDATISDLVEAARSDGEESGQESGFEAGQEEAEERLGAPVTCPACGSPFETWTGGLTCSRCRRVLRLVVTD